VRVLLQRELIQTVKLRLRMAQLPVAISDPERKTRLTSWLKRTVAGQAQSEASHAAEVLFFTNIELVPGQIGEIPASNRNPQPNPGDPVDKTPGRNDPCHCGSGLKYKKCHADSDHRAAGSPQLRLLSNAPEPARRRILNLPPAAQLNRAWEVDLAPVPATFADDPAARPTAILVAAPPFVLSAEVVNRPSAEPAALAQLVAAEIQKAVESTGTQPTHVSIRHAVLAKPLRDILQAQGIAVQVAEQLPGVEDALRSLLGHVYGGIAPLNLLHAKPETWAGWDMSADRVEKLFRAAANFFRAAPWELVLDEAPIFVKRPSGHEWTTITMGAAGQQIGLALYEDAEDLDRMQYGPDSDPASTLSAIQGLTISLLFNTRAELPKPMRAEIQREGWDIASPNAYPTLMILNSPGGGIREQHFDDLIAALESVPRFIQLHEPIFDGATQGTPDVSWVDPENHVRCRMELEDDEFEDEEFEPLGALPAVLEAAGPIGAGATPLAALEEADAAKSVNRTLMRYRAWLRKPASDSPPPATLVRAHANYARMLVERCAYSSLKPITAVTEYDVREFLYDWYPRMVRDTERGAMEMLASLPTFFEFLESREQVICPWVWPVLADTATFKSRWASFPGGHFWEPVVQDWQQVLVFDLAARLLIPINSPDGGIEWGAAMGRVEHVLNREAHRLWIVWRDEALSSGMAAAEVYAFIFTRHRAWTKTANALCGDVTPARAIAKERKEQRRT